MAPACNTMPHVCARRVGLGQPAIYRKTATKTALIMEFVKTAHANVNHLGLVSVVFIS